MKRRVIARLDIKGPNLVKGIQLEGLRVLGSPSQYARHYYEQGADELIYQDVVASLYERNSLHDLIAQTAQEVFIPLTVGGGIRTVEDIQQVLRAGADKVAINTAAIKNPDLINEAAKRFGSSTVVVSIEVIPQPDGRYLAYTDNGRNETGVEAVGWAREAAERGAGEIVITSVDREGTGKGFDLPLLKKIAESVAVPVIAHGGAGSAQHIVDLFKKTEVSAVAVAGILHYHTLSELSMSADGAAEGNTHFLKSGASYSRVTPTALSAIKSALAEADIPSRVRQEVHP